LPPIIRLKGDDSMHQTILLTGRPGIGKTTIIRRVVSRLHVPAHGFYTAEIRQGRRRQGFEIVTLAGERATLAHVDIHSEHRISRYGVDVSALERVGVAAIEAGIDAGGLLVIDEIGPMEMMSPRFRQAVLEALDSDVQVIGTVYGRSARFTDQLKGRADVEVITVTRENRDALVEQILEQLSDR
jgi:nucleoside-triphosphatase